MVVVVTVCGPVRVVSGTSVQGAQLTCGAASWWWWVKKGTVGEGVSEKLRRALARMEQVVSCVGPVVVVVRGAKQAFNRVAKTHVHLATVRTQPGDGQP